MACGLSSFAFFVYALNYLSRLPVGDGSGFQWLAAVPLTGIFVFLCIPTLILAAFKRTSKVGIAAGVCGIIAYAILWQQLLTEFGGAR